MTAERPGLQSPTLEVPASAEGAASFDFIQTFQEAMDAYGDRLPVDFGGVPGVLLANPYDVTEVLHEKEGALIKGPIYNVISDILGRGSLVLDGTEWRRNRRLIAPSLRRPQVQSMIDTIASVGGAYVDELRERCQDGRLEVDIKEEMAVLAFNTLTAVSMGRHACGVLEGVTYDNTIKHTFDLAQQNRGERTPGVIEDVQRTRQRLRALSMQAINNARGQEPDGTLVSKLAHAARKEHSVFGQELSDAEKDEIICDELTNTEFAGYETTAITLAWMFKFLQNHPEVVERMRDEIETVLGNEPPNETTLPQLTYIHQVVYEVLRRRPPAPVVARWSVEEFPLDGYTIEPNTLVLSYLYGVHHNKKYWNEPEVFDPERFSAENVANRPRELYVPFADGPRKCTGMYLAVAEVAAFTAMLLKNFTIATPDMTPKMNLVLDPKTTTGYVELRTT